MPRKIYKVDFSSSVARTRFLNSISLLTRVPSSSLSLLSNIIAQGVSLLCDLALPMIIPAFHQQPVDKIYPKMPPKTTQPQSPAQHTTKSPSNQEFIQNTRDYISEKYSNYAVPTAQMIEMPSREHQASDKSFTSPRSKGKSKVLNAEASILPSASSTIQQAGRTDDAEDITVFELPTPPPTSRKRRPDTDDLEVLPPKAPKGTKRNHNKRYDNCSKETKKQRDELIERIDANWQVSYEQWMPSSLMPSFSPNKGKTRQTLQPRDWSLPLLKALYYFSEMTKNDQKKAFKALRDVVSSKDLSGGGPQQLRESDVQCAMKNWEKNKYQEPEPVIGHSLAGLPDVSSSAFARFGGQDFGLANANVAQDQTYDPLMPVRSPTFAPEAIKVEPGLAVPHKASVTQYDEWDDEDEPLAAMEHERKENLFALKILQGKRRQRLKAQGRSSDDAILVGFH